MNKSKVPATTDPGNPSLLPGGKRRHAARPIRRFATWTLAFFLLGLLVLALSGLSPGLRQADPRAGVNRAQQAAPANVQRMRAAEHSLSLAPVRVQRSLRPLAALAPLADQSMVRPLGKGEYSALHDPWDTSAPSSFEAVPLRKGDYGTQPLPRIITYTVQPGDTLSTIATRFGLTLDTLRWSNPDLEYNPDDLYPGQVVRIPPLNGVIHDVRPGDTVERLARRYNVPPEVIREYAPNRLRPPYTLTPGMPLIIPGGTKIVSLPPPRPYPGYTYMWPARGTITQRFGRRHRGLDIGTIYGAYVYAARGGRVRTARWDDTGYGYMIIIDHGGGWNTLYAHLKGALVRPGQWVSQGEVIGRVGGTGRATGPHVHFEVRKGRTRYDPEKYLPPRP